MNPMQIPPATSTGPRLSRLSGTRRRAHGWLAAALAPALAPVTTPPGVTRFARSTPAGAPVVLGASGVATTASADDGGAGGATVYTMTNSTAGNAAPPSAQGGTGPSPPPGRSLPAAPAPGPPWATRGPWPSAGRGAGSWWSTPGATSCPSSASRRGPARAG